MKNSQYYNIIAILILILMGQIHTDKITFMVFCIIAIGYYIAATYSGLKETKEKNILLGTVGKEKLKRINDIINE